MRRWRSVPPSGGDEGGGYRLVGKLEMYKVVH